MSLSPCTVTPLGLREDPEILPYYRPRPRLGTWQRAEWLKKSSHRSDPPSIGGTHHVTPMTRATGLGEALGTRRLGFTNSNQSSGLHERKKKNGRIYFVLAVSTISQGEDGLASSVLEPHIT